MSEGRATGRSAGGRRGKGDRLRSGAVAPRAAALRGRVGSAGLRVHGDGTLLILMNLLLIFLFCFRAALSVVVVVVVRWLVCKRAHTLTLLFPHHASPPERLPPPPPSGKLHPPQGSAVKAGQSRARCAHAEPLRAFGSSTAAPGP